MHIWVDADACPKVIKDILFRAAVRTKTMLTLVSNHALQAPPSVFINKVQVMGGFDVADEKIVEYLQPRDLVITADIPLADAAIQKGGQVLNPRGTLYLETNIKEKLAFRNLSTDLRSMGVRLTGPEPLSKKDIERFANELNTILLNAANSQR